ncbi:MAG: hypothetical protein R6U19_06330 [Bacteroidales bacterium]
MDSHEIISNIKNPAQASPEKTETLQRLVRQYPFSATLHLLLLKNLKTTEHSAYKNNLHHSAAYIHNHEHAYNWLHQRQEAPPSKSPDPGSRDKPWDETARIGKGLTEAEKEAQMQNDLRQWEKEHDFPRKKDEPQKPGEKQNAETANHKSDISTLINKFVHHPPKITLDKDKNYEQEEKLASNSIKDNPDFVSETLGRIYEQQGKITKAMEVYKKLSLKFPEKKRYFASLIENLSNKSDSSN